MAVVFASKAHQVRGVDIDAEKINALKQGRFESQEPLVSGFLAAYRENMEFTTSYAAVYDTEISFIVTQTPSRQDGSFSLKYVKQVCHNLGAILQEKEFHLVVLTSTVSPRSCDEVLIPILEEASEKVCGRDFGFCFSPELVAIGRVVFDFLEPSFYIIGASDSRAGNLLERFYETISSREILRTNLVNAEIAKLAINCFLTTKISFANTIGALCEPIPAANAHEVIRLVSKDPRISPKFLKPGFGYGGHCFPRDNQAFIATSKHYQIPAWIQEASDQVNRWQLERIIHQVQGYIGSRGTVSILGLAYKPGTPSIEESMAIKLVERLAELGYIVKAYDPAVGTGTNLNECVTDTDLVVICTPWPEFKHIRNPLLEDGIPVIDPWGMVRI